MAKSAKVIGAACAAGLIAALAVYAADSDSGAEVETRAALANPPTVTCDEIILRVRSGREGSGGGYRVVLGVVSVPQAYRPQVLPNGPPSWPYFSKAGLVVRGDSPLVHVMVPKSWRNRAAITWGNNTGIVSALRIAPCPAAAKPWNAYAGGFYLRSRSACVPLIFRVGERSAAVRFGLGKKCE